MDEKDFLKSKNQKLGKSTILIDKNGEEHFVKNISAFCRENDLEKGSIYSMINGRTKIHKGWTIKK